MGFGLQDLLGCPSLTRSFEQELVRFKRRLAIASAIKLRLRPGVFGDRDKVDACLLFGKLGLEGVGCFCRNDAANSARQFRMPSRGPAFKGCPTMV